MWRIIKGVFYLIVLGGLALLAYAYIGPVFFPQDFTPPSQEITESITLPAGG